MILYEDNHLIAVNKLAGTLVQGDRTGDKPLADMVKGYIKKKYNKPGDVFLGVPHRIDRPVGGVVLFCRTSKALERVTVMFKDQKMEKTYLAIVGIVPPKKQGVLVDHLVKNHEKNISYVVKEGSTNSKRCELSYDLISSGRDAHLLMVKPVTGRPHQIRVQLANLGSPILGDLKYGAKKPLRDATICLHAFGLQFQHPVTKEDIKLQSEPPANKQWSWFNKLINSIKL